MVKVKGKIFKVGTGYGIRLSKLWIDSKIVELGQEIEIDSLLFDHNQKRINDFGV